MAKGDTPKKDAHSFETKLGALEALIEEMESGELGLEESVDRFKQGVGQLTELRGLLEDASTRVTELTEDLRASLEALEGSAEDE